MKQYFKKHIGRFLAIFVAMTIFAGGMTWNTSYVEAASNVELTYQSYANNEKFWVTFRTTGSISSWLDIDDGLTVYIDEVETEYKGWDYFTLSGLNDGTLQIVFPYTDIEAGAADPDSFTKQHMIEIKAGSTMGGTTITNGIKLLVNGWDIIEYSEITLAGDPQSDYGGSSGLYLTAEANSLSYKDDWSVRYQPEICVNGTQIAGASLVKYTSTRYYLAFDECKVTFQQGDVVDVSGEIRLDRNSDGTKDLLAVFQPVSFTYDGANKWEPTVSIQMTAIQTADTYYRLFFDISGGQIQNWSDLDTNSTLLLDDCSAVAGVSGTLKWRAVSVPNAQVLLDVPYSVFGVDSAAAVTEEHFLEIPAGTKWGSTKLTKGVTFLIVKDTILEYQEAALSAGVGMNFGDAGGVNCSASENALPYSSDWQTRYSATSGLDIRLNGEKYPKNAEQAGAEVIKAGATEYHIVFDNCGVTPFEKDDIVTISGDVRYNDILVRFPEKNFVFDGKSWSETDHNPAVTTTVVNWGSKWKTEKNLYFMTSVTPASFGEDWRRFYNVTVTINGTTQKCSVDLAAKDIFYVVMDSITVEDGMTVKLDSEITDGTFVLRMKPALFERKDGAWVPARLPDTGIPGDADGDGEITSADIVRMKYEMTYGGTSLRMATEGVVKNQSAAPTSEDWKQVIECVMAKGEDGVPVYLDDQEIQLAAYAGPQPIDTAICQEGVEVGKLNVSHITEAEFKRYADAGLNTLITEGAVPWCSVSNRFSGGGYWQNLTDYMSLAESMGLGVIVSSEYLNSYLNNRNFVNAGNNIELSETVLQTELNELYTGLIDQGQGSWHVSTDASIQRPNAKGMKEYSNFKGFLLADEIPLFDGEDVMDETVAERLDSALTVMESLNPMMQTFSSQLQTEYYAAEFAERTGTYCYSLYPLQTESDNLKERWLSMLEISASICSSVGATPGITLQAAGQVVKRSINGNYVEDTSLGLRVPDQKQDIGFQVYTALAYGMKYLNYFTYSPHQEQSAKHYYMGSMIEYDAQGNVIETDTYRAVQAVNREILKFDHVFLDYDWQGTVSLQGTDADGMMAGLTSYTSDRIITSTSTEDAVIGCMYDDDKKLDGFWIVNATNPADNLSNTITVRFKDASRVLVYHPAEGVYGEVQQLNDGTYVADLGSGEGQFVIPLL